MPPLCYYIPPAASALLRLPPIAAIAAMSVSGQELAASGRQTSAPEGGMEASA